MHFQLISISENIKEFSVSEFSYSHVICYGAYRSASAAYMSAVL